MNDPSRTSRRRRALAIAALAVVGSTPLAVASPSGAATLRERNGGQPASAAATAVGLPFSQWRVFTFGGTGSRSAVFTFFSSTPVALRVTDAACRGDEFRVFDRGFALFDTSTVGTDPTCDDEPFAGTGPTAWADQSYSKGRFLLQPGRHRVQIQATDSPFGGGAGFVRIDRRPVG